MSNKKIIKKTKARADYACQLCGKTIYKNEHYIREPKFINKKTVEVPYHVDCYAFIKAYKQKEDARVVKDGDVKRWLVDTQCSKCVNVDCDVDVFNCDKLKEMCLDREIITAGKANKCKFYCDNKDEPCRALNVKKCDIENCTFKKTEQEYQNGILKSNNRLRTLSMEKQQKIADKYYSGLRLGEAKECE